MTRDRLLEAFSGIVSPDLREAIFDAVCDALFLESLVSGGSDDYQKTAAEAQGGKPESSTPAGIDYVECLAASISSFRSVSARAKLVVKRLDKEREIHDRGEAYVEDQEIRRKAPAVSRHLLRKIAAEYEGRPTEDERG